MGFQNLSHFSHLSLREKILFYFCTISATLSIFLYSFIFPWMDENEQLRDQITSAQKKLFEYQKAIRQKDDLQKLYGEIGKFPTPNPLEETDKNILLKTIDDIQKQTGVQLQNIEPMPTEVKPLYKLLQVRVEAEDTLDNLLRFVLLLKDTPEKLNLTSLRLAPVSQNKETLKASFLIGKFFTPK